MALVSRSFRLHKARATVFPVGPISMIFLGDQWADKEHWMDCRTGGPAEIPLRAWRGHLERASPSTRTREPGCAEEGAMSPWPQELGMTQRKHGGAGLGARRKFPLELDVARRRAPGGSSGLRAPLLGPQGSSVGAGRGLLSAATCSAGWWLPCQKGRCGARGWMQSPGLPAF